jgi:hypothetical protein
MVPEGAGSLYLAFRLPALFQKAGWDVDLLCLAGDPLIYSRYLRASLQEENFDDVFSRLQKILRDPQRPWQSVIVTHEKITRRLIATGDAALLRNWQPGAMDPPVNEFLLDKFGLATAGHAWQLPIPPCRICRTLSDVESFGSDAGWPIIVKPPGESSGTGVARFDSPKHLASDRATFMLPVLAQKYVAGRRGVAEMLCSAGRPLAWLSSYSTKRSYGEFGPSTARLFRAMPELQPMVEQLARMTRFEGFCGFDWIEEETTGRHYLIEFHPRPGSGFRFGRVCGVDFPAAIAAWLRREADAFPTLVQAPGISVAAHYFSCDLLRCFRQRDWQGLKPWLPGSGACHDVFWDDAPLLAAWVIQRCRRLFSDKLRPGAKTIPPNAPSQCAGWIPQGKK